MWRFFSKAMISIHEGKRHEIHESLLEQRNGGTEGGLRSAGRDCNQSCALSTDRGGRAASGFFGLLLTGLEPLARACVLFFPWAGRT